MSVAAAAAIVSGLFRLSFAWYFLPTRRSNDNEIREIPRKGRLLAAISRPAVAWHLHLVSQGLGATSIGLTTVPRHHDGQLGRSCFQGVKAPHRAAADDDFKRFFLRSRGTAGGGGGLCRHVLPSYRPHCTKSLILSRLVRPKLSGSSQIGARCCGVRASSRHTTRSQSTPHQPGFPFGRRRGTGKAPQRNHDVADRASRRRTRHKWNDRCSKQVMRHIPQRVQ